MPLAYVVEPHRFALANYGIPSHPTGVHVNSSEACGTPEVLKPSTVQELAACIADNPSARIVGGGTLEVPRWIDPAARPERVVLLDGIPELAVAYEGVCGSGVTLARVAADLRIPRVLRQAACSIAGPAVRSTATVGGNVAGLAPGCLAVALLSLGAAVEVLERRGNRRWQDLSELLQDPPTDGCVILGFRWPAEPSASSFQKVTESAGGGVPLVTVAVSSRNQERTLWGAAVGGQGLLPQRLPALERHLAPVSSRGTIPDEHSAAREIQFHGVHDERERAFRRALIDRQIRAALSSIQE